MKSKVATKLNESIITDNLINVEDKKKKKDTLAVKKIAS
jgi:hypothetical protein